MQNDITLIPDFGKKMNEPAGLGNYLIPLFRIIILSKKRGVKWAIKNKFFLQLFEDTPFNNINNKQKTEKINNNCHIIHSQTFPYKLIKYIDLNFNGFGYFNFSQEYQVDYTNILQDLTINQNIQTAVDDFSYKHFDENTISIHIRSWISSSNPDTNDGSAQRRHENFSYSLQKYFDIIRSRDDNTNFFIAVDDFKLKDTILQTFPTKKFIFFSRIDSFTPIVNDFIELVLLGRNKELIGCHESTFTIAAWILRSPRLTSITTILRDQITHQSSI